MRVLHVTPYFAPAFVYGGPPRSVLGLCRAMRAAGADVSVMTSSANGDGELPESVTARGAHDGVPVVYVPRGFPRRSFRAPALGPLLAARLREGVDIVHIHGCWNPFGWTAAGVCRSMGIPYVISPRGMLHPWSFSHARVRKWLSYQAVDGPILRGARFVHATSRSEAEVVDALELGRPIVTIPNGIVDETAAVRGRAESFRDRYAIPREASVVLFLGRLHPKKGVPILIDAFRQASRTHPETRLVVAGSGVPEYVRSLEERAGELAAERRVIFTGHLAGDDRAMALASANAFALTSYSENFGLGVGEAMAAGLPVVATRACPWPSIIEWRAGWWVDPTADAVARALSELFADPDAARAMGERGREGVRYTYDWSRIGRLMLDAYAGALAN